MQLKKTHESGSIMVEVIAVIALLGVMGTMMFRQIQRRNEELDNINMASEIRMIKEAATAYIQANKAMLEATDCPAIGDDAVSVTNLSPGEVEKFLPDNWISEPETENGIIHEYKIELSCYRIDSAAADNRLAMYATIIPNDPNDPNEAASPLPPNFSYRRAARVATLIGSDGGIYENGSLVGTAGAWEISCESSSCAGRKDNFYVATTGMDIYIPETGNTADNTVSVPHSIAFENLHATDYFSVGDGSVGNGTNCIGNYNTDGGKFAHEALTLNPDGVGYATDDEILHAGGPCEPLFWVGAAAGGEDRSRDGQVYVKNNLYIGRDNTNNTQAVAIETGANNTITVFDTAGHGTVTLNGAGQIIGRADSTGKGYKLDAENGEIVLFEEVTANINGTAHTVRIPTMRLKNGRMETNVNAQYYDDEGNLKEDVYAVDPAGESLMNDIRLTSRGGAKLSDILPDYILKGTQTITKTNGDTFSVTKPSCPRGYAAAITVTPIRYSQYVTGASLNLNLATNSAGNTTHSHSISGNISNVSQSIHGNTNGNTLRVNGTSGNVSGSSLTLTQLPPVRITISSEDSGEWSVGLRYGAQSATTDDPITALAQTYCVFDSVNFNATSSATGTDGMRIEAKSAGKISNRACTPSSGCENTEACVNGYCHLLGSCTEPDNTSLGENIYCLNGVQVYLECFEDIDCSSGKKCSNNKCVNTGS